jgi:hypothetical protein
MLICVLTHGPWVPGYPNPDSSPEPLRGECIPSVASFAVGPDDVRFVVSYVLFLFGHDASGEARRAGAPPLVSVDVDPSL